MVAILIFSNNRGKNTCSAIMNKSDCNELAKVMQGDPETKIIDPDSELAIEFLDKAMQRIMEGRQKRHGKLAKED